MDDIPIISNGDLSGEIKYLPLYPKGTTHTIFPIKSDSGISNLKVGDKFQYRERVYEVKVVESDPSGPFQGVVYKCLMPEVFKPDV